MFLFKRPTALAPEAVVRLAAKRTAPPRLCPRKAGGAVRLFWRNHGVCRPLTLCSWSRASIRSQESGSSTGSVRMFSPQPGIEPMTKVLLIEDDSETAEEITAELADRGFEVEWSANGIEGLDKARSSRPDAMIVDRLLPGMDGLTVIEALAEGSGPHPGAGAERAGRGGRPRARIADGGRRLSHQTVRARRTCRQDRGVAAPAGGIARDDVAGRAAGTRSDRAHRQTRRSRHRSACRANFACSNT